MAHIEILELNETNKEKPEYKIIIGVYSVGNMCIADVFQRTDHLFVDIHGDANIVRNVNGVPYGNALQFAKREKINEKYKVTGLKQMMLSLDGQIEIYCEKAVLI